jgi:long-chain acyl-CoA synthetase
MTLLDMLARSAGRVPHRPAFVFRERRMSYADLQGQALMVGGLLRGLGVRQGDRVVLVLPNVPEFGVGYFGILAAGATVVPLNPLLKPEEVRYVLEDAGATGMVCTQVSSPLLQAARQGLGRSIPALVLDADPASLDTGDLASAAAPKPLPPFLPPPLDTEDVAACLYTSGTTGRPKGAMLSHRNLLANIESFREILHVTEEDVFLAVLPLFHAYAATVVFLEPLSIGATIVLEPRFVPELTLKAIAEHRVTLFAGVPTMFAVLAKLPRPPADFSAWRLCISGGAPLPPPVLEAFEARYGVPIYEGYGPTECAPVLTVNPPLGVRKIGSVGPPIPQVELRIVDEQGNTLPPGQMGEVVARGPNVMKGYLNRPEETAEVLHEGWYHTGDLGQADEDGYYYIVGRKKDLILVGGLNVYPREVELVLTSHPAVADAAVIGVPDPVRGEVPKALVVLRDGQQTGVQELLQWCRQRLASYKVPRTVELLAELPKTATGKTLKQQLRAAAQGGQNFKPTTEN